MSAFRAKNHMRVRMTKYRGSICQPPHQLDLCYLPVRIIFCPFELQSPQPTPQQDTYMQDFGTE